VNVTIGGSLRKVRTLLRHCRAKKREAMLVIRVGSEPLFGS